MPATVTGLTLTQDTAQIPIGTLSWSHDGIDLDRFMVGYKVGTTWRDLDPQPKASFGTGPYTFKVPLISGAAWRVLALNAAGDRSA